MVFRQFTILERKPKIMRFYLLLLSSFISLSAHAQVDADLSLHYKFDDDLLDASVTMLDGTQQGGELLFDGGVEGKAVNFSDKGEYVYIDTSYQLELPFSISVWLKPQDLTRAWQTTISKYQVAFYGSFWFGLHFDKANMWLPIGNGQEVFYDSQASLVPNEWNHIVWVCDEANQGTMYINGEKDAAMGFIPDVFHNSDSLMLGRQALYLDITGDYANYYGGMDDLRVYNKVLGDGEVEQLFTMTSRNENELAVTPQVFPNPSSGVFNLVGLDNMTELRVFDNMGRTLVTRKLQQSTLSLDLLGLESGVYYCKLQNEITTFTYKLQLY